MHPQGYGPRHEYVVVTSASGRIGAVGERFILHEFVTRAGVALDIQAVAHHRD